MKRRIFITYIFIMLAVMIMMVSCSQKKTPEPPPTAPIKRQYPARKQPKPVDLQAQQRYYDLGLKYYADEHYGEAKNAFQQAIEYGPESTLAGKARENLLKTEQVLRTLRELEQK